MKFLKRIFGNNNGDKIRNAKVSQEVTKENQEKIIGLLNVREQYTTDMFDAIKRYTATRDQLIKRSITQQNNLSKEDSISIISDFIENIAEQLPQGVLVPIKTSFVYRGKSQILFVGNKMLLAGKTLKANAKKPRQTLKEKQLVGFLLDFDEELNVFDTNTNSKVTLSKERRPKVINLISEPLIDTKTANCRLGNLEFVFSNIDDSLESVVQIDDMDLINELLEYIVSLDYEITTSITNFFNTKAEKKEEEAALAQQVVNTTVEPNNEEMIHEERVEEECNCDCNNHDCDNTIDDSHSSCDSCNE